VNNSVLAGAEVHVDCWFPADSTVGHVVAATSPEEDPALQPWQSVGHIVVDEGVVAAGVGVNAPVEVYYSQVLDGHVPDFKGRGDVSYVVLEVDSYASQAAVSIKCVACSINNYVASVNGDAA